MRSSILRPSWLALHRTALLRGAAIAIGFTTIVWLVVLRPAPRTVPLVIPVTVPVAVAIPAKAAPVAQHAVLFGPELHAISNDGASVITAFRDGESKLVVRRIEVASGISFDKSITSRGDIEAVQAILDAGKYRPLDAIPQVDMGSEHVDGISMLYDDESDPTGMTILDEADNDRTLWHTHFEGARAIQSWWDPQTAIILAEVHDAASVSHHVKKAN